MLPTKSSKSSKSKSNSPKTTEHGYLILKGSPETAEMDCALLKFDGLAAPNPGECTGAAVCWGPNVRHEKGIVFERGAYQSRGTNNQGEYMGLLLGLQSAAKLGYPQLLIEGDSDLVIQQTAGIWNVNSDGLKPLHAAVQELLFGDENPFTFVAIRHVPRERNVYADRLTNEVLVTKKGFFRKKKAYTAA